MAYYYDIYSKSFSIIFNYLKLPEKKSFIKLIEYETKVIKINNEINRKYSDIRSSVTVSKTIFYRKKYINLKVKWGLFTDLLLLLMKRYELMRGSW